MVSVSSDEIQVSEVEPAARAVDIPHQLLADSGESLRGAIVNGVTILQGDCRQTLKTLPDNSIHCCVTSPPYFGLRDYGCDGQIGLEQTPEDFIDQMVDVFREVKRVLRKDGVLWLNLGDSYAGNRPGTEGGSMLQDRQRLKGKTERRR